MMALPEKSEDQFNRAYGDFGRWVAKGMMNWATRLPGRFGEEAVARIAAATQTGVDLVAPNRAALRKMEGTGREVIEVQGQGLAAFFRTELRQNKIPFVREFLREEDGAKVFRFIVPANQLGMVRASLEDATASHEKHLAKAASRQERAKEVRSKADTLAESGGEKTKELAKAAPERGDSR